MSLPFNDTTNLKGLVQVYEDEIGADRGFVANNTQRLKEFCASVNLAWDDYLALAFKAEGRWQFDDSNHTDYAVIKTNLVSGQRDYTFITDEHGNIILDVYKVAILQSATATEYTELEPFDELSDRDNAIVSENNTTAVPLRYAKTANGIILETPPGFTTTATPESGVYGLKVYINREPSYFTYTDTTKKPGCPGIHHRYFAIKPAFDYARQKGLDRYNQLREEVVSYEGDEEKSVVGSIERHFARRARDERPRITSRPINFI